MLLGIAPAKKAFHRLDEELIEVGDTPTFP